MGWTGYPEFTTNEQAIQYELRGCEVIRRSGNWFIVKLPSGQIDGLRIMTAKGDGCPATKVIGFSSGPGEVPPEPFYRAWLALCEREGITPRHYEPEWRERCEATYAKRRKVGTLVPGTRFRVVEPYHFADGVSEDTFTLVERYRARRVSDGCRVRLPRGFRDRIAEVVSA